MIYPIKILYFVVFGRGIREIALLFLWQNRKFTSEIHTEIHPLAENSRQKFTSGAHGARVKIHVRTLARYGARRWAQGRMQACASARVRAAAVEMPKNDRPKKFLPHLLQIQKLFVPLQ